MVRKVFPLFSLMVMISLLFVACSGPAAAPAQTGSEPAVKETVLVTVEVTRQVEGNAPPAVTAPIPEGYGATLKQVQERGKLICGGNGSTPGFGFLDSNGKWTGFDVDFCRAIAAAIFGDPNKVEIRPLTSKDRFTALQTGEIDVLIRNATRTLTRDTEVGGNFAPTTFYDGQGFIVPKDSGITKIEELDGGTVCVLSGSTSETNLANVMAARNISYTPVVFEAVDDFWAAYEQGRCDALTTDKSGIVSRKGSLADPSAHVILNETISKEPLTPMVRHGDDQWFDIVSYVTFATINGEELGISSTNVDDLKANTQNPDIKAFLGLEGGLGTKLGISDDWAYNIIKNVGNYAEIYDRNFGPNTPTYMDRALNSLYTDGGLLYSMPFK